MVDKNGGLGRAELRALAFLARGQAEFVPSAGVGVVLLCAGDRGQVALPAAALDALHERGLISRAGGQATILARGRRLLDAARSSADSRNLGGKDDRARMSSNATVPMVNDDESPLAQIARYRTRDGLPFLTDLERRAGEKLRADYTRAQIMPRLGANWEAAVTSGRRASGPGGAAEISDGALAARMRVEKALAAVGPELSGVLVDICCFLKGLSVVEIERGWPVRSAKVVLKTALGSLGRHYEPAPARRPGAILKWGAADHRPTIGGSGGLG